MVGNEHEIIVTQMLLSQCQHYDNIHSVFLYVLKEKASVEAVKYIKKIFPYSSKLINFILIEKIDKTT